MKRVWTFPRHPPSPLLTWHISTVRSLTYIAQSDDWSTWHSQNKELLCQVIIACAACCCQSLTGINATATYPFDGLLQVHTSASTSSCTWTHFEHAGRVCSKCYLPFFPLGMCFGCFANGHTAVTTSTIVVPCSSMMTAVKTLFCL